MENTFSAEKRIFKYVYILFGLKCSWMNRQKKPCNEGIFKYSIYNENHECSSALRGGENILSQWRDGRTVIKFSMTQTNRPLSLLHNILRAGRTGSISYLPDLINDSVLEHMLNWHGSDKLEHATQMFRPGREEVCYYFSTFSIFILSSIEYLNE